MAQLLSTTINGNLTVSGNILPYTTNNVGIGNPSYKFNAIYTNTIYAGGVAAPSSAAGGNGQLYLVAPGNIFMSTNSGGITIITAQNMDVYASSYINMSATAMKLYAWSYVTFYNPHYFGTNVSGANANLLLGCYSNNVWKGETTIAAGSIHTIEIAQNYNFWAKFDLFDSVVSTTTKAVRGTTTSSASGTVGPYLSILATLLYANGYTTSAAACPAHGIYWGGTTTSKMIVGIYATQSNNSAAIGFKYYTNNSNFTTGTSSTIYAYAGTQYVYLYDKVRTPQPM